MIARALDRGILGQANTRSTALLENFLRGAGFKSADTDSRLAQVFQHSAFQQASS